VDPEAIFNNIALGGTLAITIGNELVWSAYYKPFGQECPLVQNADTDVLFAGSKKDSESGLNYMIARYMDSSIGRFTAPDPIGAVDPKTGKVNDKIIGNLQRQNPYAYVDNDPANRIDPLGLNPDDVFTTRDAAARDALNYIFSHYPQGNEDSEYVGWIYRLEGDVDPFSGEPYYSYTEPVPGAKRDIQPETFNQPCPGNEKTDIYHSHPGDAYNVGQYSNDDYNYAAFHNYPIYLGTSSGLVRGYMVHNFISQPADGLLDSY
jgi:RHS repeat-associated protein